MAEITVIIKRDGETLIDVEGFSGVGCTELTKALEEALGKQGERRFKPEYYEEEPVKISNKVEV